MDFPGLGLPRVSAVQARWKVSFELRSGRKVIGNCDCVELTPESSNYRSVPDRLASTQDNTGFVSSSHISVDASTVFADPSNPTVEVLNMCFPTDIDDATRAAVDAQFKDFVDKALRAPAMCGSFVQGWTDKNVQLPGEDKGKTGRLLVSLISWPSVERHMENRDTQAFKDSVHLLRTLPSLVKLDVFHVNCKTVTG